MPEPVLMIWDIYDGPRTGIALHNGLPHFFRCLFSEETDDYSEFFELCPITTGFLEKAQRQWQIYREWESLFHNGKASLETHPGHRNVDAEYDELEDWLSAAVGKLQPIDGFYKADFRALPGQDRLASGILRELEVTWLRIE